ncbi:MAG: hypothetical protein JF616_01700 [Fibrobacteres bacterium]|nr:hypothetical protein [Fibrobacterota bacterium]
MGIEWKGDLDFGHAFNELQGLSGAELGKRKCTRACVLAIDRSAPPSPFVLCSRACLESVLPEKWKSAWKSALPGAYRTDVKPISYSFSESLKFFPDSVVSTIDTTWTTCSSIDTAKNRIRGAFDALNQFELSKSVRDVYHGWRVGRDTLYLAAGVRRTTTAYPPTHRFRPRYDRDTAALPDVGLRFQMSQRHLNAQGGLESGRVLVLPGKTWREPVYRGL